VAFCPSVSELSFLSFVVLYFPSGGCSFVGKVVVFDFEANLFFAVLSYGEVDLFGPRGTNFVSPCCGCSHLCEVGVVDLRGRFVLAVLFFLVKPIFWASRHELLFPLMWVSSFHEAGVFGPQDEFIFYGALLWKKIVVFDS